MMWSEPHILEHIFSKNFMACLMNQAAKSDRYLHNAAVNSLLMIESVCRAHPEIIPTILKQLVGKKGAYDFSHKTHQKTVTKCLQHAEPVVGECLEILRKRLMKLEATDADKVTNYLHAYADYLSKLVAVATPNLQADSAIREPKSTEEGSGVLKELMLLAYSNVDHPIINCALTGAIRDVFRSHVEQAFSKMVKSPADSIIVCHTMQSVSADAIIMDKGLSKYRDDALSAMRQIIVREKTASPKKKSVYQGMGLLYAAAMSQLYAQDPDALEFLQDLTQINAKIDAKGFSEGEIPQGLPTFLVETLLSLLGRKSVFTRHISIKAFEAFANIIDIDALEILTGALFAEENERGYMSLFDSEFSRIEIDGLKESDESISEYESDNDQESDPNIAVQSEDAIMEVDSDVEFVDLETASNIEVSSDVDIRGKYDDDNVSTSKIERDREEEEKYIPNSGATEENLAALDDMLAKILRSRKDDDQQNSSQIEEDDSDSDMTDSAMLVLDEQIAEVFRQQVNSSNAINSIAKQTKEASGSGGGKSKIKQKEARNARETVINFKRRVLDLLSVFMRSRPLSHLTAELLVPILGAMDASTTNLVRSRAGQVVEEYWLSLVKARKSRATREATGAASVAGQRCDVQDGRNHSDTLVIQSLKENLTSILQLAEHNETIAFARAAAKAGRAVATTLIRAKEENSKINTINKSKESNKDTSKNEDEDDKDNILISYIDPLYHALRCKKLRGEAFTHDIFFEEYRVWRSGEHSSRWADKEVWLSTQRDSYHGIKSMGESVIEEEKKRKDGRIRDEKLNQKGQKGKKKKRAKKGKRRRKEN